MSLSHRLALSDVLNSLHEHLFLILSRQVRQVEFRLYETKGEFLSQVHCIYFDFHWHIYANTHWHIYANTLNYIVIYHKGIVDF